MSGISDNEPLQSWAEESVLKGDGCEPCRVAPLDLLTCEEVRTRAEARGCCTMTEFVLVFTTAELIEEALGKVALQMWRENFDEAV